MKRTKYLLLSLGFIASSIAQANQCNQAKSDMIKVQQRQNEIVGPASSDEKAKSRGEIKKERDKALAELLLQRGITSALERFNKTLKDIKLPDSKNTLAKMLQNSDNLDVLDTIEAKVEDHKKAVDNVGTIYTLLQDFSPYDFSEFSKRAFHKVTGKEVGTEDPDGSLAATWKNVDGVQLYKIFEETCYGSKDFKDSSETGALCDKILKSDNNSKERQKTVMGFLGLMKNLSPDSLNVQREDYKAEQKQREVLAKTYTTMIEENMPQNYIQSGKFKSFDEGSDNLTHLNNVQDHVKSLVKNKEELLAAKQAIISCELRGDDCSAKYKGVESAKVAFKSLNEYINENTSDEPGFRRTKAELEEVKNALSSFSEDSEMKKLLSQANQDLKQYDPAKSIENIFNDDSNNSVRQLAGNITNGNAAELAIFKNAALKKMLNSKNIGCNLKANLPDASTANDDFRKEMIDCMIRLKNVNIARAFQQKGKDLMAKIEDYDDQLNDIDGSRTFKDLERLKRIAYNQYMRACDADVVKNEFTCNTDKNKESSPVDLGLGTLAFNTGDVVTYVTLAEKPKDESIGKKVTYSYDEHKDIEGLCNNKVGDHFASDGVQLCTKVKSRLNLRRKNLDEVEGYKNLWGNVTTKTLPDGSKISTPRRKLNYIFGYAMLNNARSWLPFGANYFATKSQIPALVSQAEVFTQHKAWADQYASRFSLGDGLMNISAWSFQNNTAS